MNTEWITQKYERESFTSFLADFLPDDFEREENEIYLESGIQRITNAFYLGRCDSLDLDVFEFCHASGHDPRVSLTRDAFSVMKKFGTKPYALAAFYNQDSQEWRFSFLSAASVLKDGKVKREFTNPRRYSFLLGKGCKSHTPEVMLCSKGTVQDIDDLQKRFDIEVVTKEFYNELFAWYTWACEKATYPVGKGANVILSNKNNETAIIRLITRLIFVWFIKQKDLVPSWIFDEAELKNILTEFDSQSIKKGNYYNAVLQNLFFATLNKAISERKFTDDNKAYLQYGIKTLYRDDCKHSFFKENQKQIVERFKSVPFLNGGLFECLDRLESDENGKNVQTYSDGFSREESRRAFLPNALFFQKEKDGHEGIRPTSINRTPESIKEYLSSDEYKLYKLI